MNRNNLNCPDHERHSDVYVQNYDQSFCIKVVHSFVVVVIVIIIIREQQQQKCRIFRFAISVFPHSKRLLWIRDPKICYRHYSMRRLLRWCFAKSQTTQSGICRPNFLLLARYVPNVAKEEYNLWDQCKKYEYWRPTTDLRAHSHILGKFQMAITLQRVNRSPSCLVLGRGFQGRRIQRRHFSGWIKFKMAAGGHLGKLQTAISQQRIIRFTVCMYADHTFPRSLINSDGDSKLIS